MTKIHIASTIKLVAAALLVVAFLLVMIYKPTPETAKVTSVSDTTLVEALDEPKATDSITLVEDKETLNHIDSEVNNAPEYDFSDLFGDKEYEDDWCNHFELTREANYESGREFDKFANERGHFSGDYNNYIDYTVEDLRELGETGDQIALYTLVNKPGIDTATKLWAGKTSSIFGGTGMVTMEQILYHKIRYRHLMAESREIEAKGALNEALAWTEFTAMRGDFILLDTEIRAMTRSIKQGDVKVEHIDPEASTRRAQEIYAELEAIRIEKGLGKFDNTLPKAAARGYDWSAAEMTVSGLNVGWGTQYLPDNPCVQKNINELSNQIMEQE